MLVSLALVGACSFDAPDLGGTEFQCDGTEGCPPGFNCVGGSCVTYLDADPNQPDADPNAPDARPRPDADPNAPDAMPLPDADLGNCGLSCSSCLSGGGCCSDTCTDTCSFTCNFCDCHFDCSAATGLCATKCQDGTTCDVNCAGTAQCQPKCEVNATCNVDCTGAGSCSATCETGAKCLLQCQGATSCGYSFCEEGEASCPGNVIVCNRACP